jgi:virulence-associated protein VapD
MFAIAFDLVVADAQKHHPKGVTQAYADIKSTLAGHGFDWVQGSLYVSKTEDLAKLFAAIMALKALTWFPPCVRDIRAFRVEQWSDFTALVKA